MQTATSPFLHTRFFSQRAVFPPGQRTMGIKIASLVPRRRSGEAAFETPEKHNSEMSNPIAAILEPRFRMGTLLRHGDDNIIILTRGRKRVMRPGLRGRRRFFGRGIKQGQPAGRPLWRQDCLAHLNPPVSRTILSKRKGRQPKPTTTRSSRSLSPCRWRVSKLEPRTQPRSWECADRRCPKYAWRAVLESFQACNTWRSNPSRAEWRWSRRQRPAHGVLGRSSSIWRLPSWRLSPPGAFSCAPRPSVWAPGRDDLPTQTRGGSRWPIPK